jgi:hypothetical protein
MVGSLVAFAVSTLIFVILGMSKPGKSLFSKD